VQNDKALHTYYSVVQGGNLPVQKGFFLNEEDMAFRQYITEISCKGSTRFQPEHLPLLKQYCFPILEAPAADGLVVYDDQQLALTENGHYFMRIICSAFDLYLQRNRDLSLQQTFSKAV
jgi:oxygen-independent coproporphyrinogen-3 oxidase